MSHTIESKHYQSADGRRFRIDIDYDELADSPRDDDNLTHMVTRNGGYAYDRYSSPDKGHPDDYVPGWEELVDSRRISRWINLFADAYFAGTGDKILAYGFLDREPRDGTMSVSFDGYDGDRPDGIIVITALEAAKFGCADFTPEQFREAMKAEVQVYNQWAQGQVVGWVTSEIITCDHGDSHDEEIASVWGYYPDEDASYGHEYDYPYSDAMSEIPVPVEETKS